MSPIPVLLLGMPKTMSGEKRQLSHRQVPNSPTARCGGIAACVGLQATGVERLFGRL